MNKKHSIQIKYILREYYPFMILIVPGILLSLFFIFIPVIYAVYLSFFKLETIASPLKYVALSNYLKILSLPVFWSDLLNGTIFAVGSVSCQVILGIIIALILDQQFRGRSVFRAVSVVPYVIPTVVVAFTWRWMLDEQIGIINIMIRAIGLNPITWFETESAAMFSAIMVSVWTWTPFVTLSFLAGLQSVPRELHEAATVDGANAMHRFFFITLPILKPIVTIVVLLRSIWMFNKFDIIWMLTEGGPLYGTEHLPILAYKRAFKMFEVGEGAAVATISFIILTGFIYYYMKKVRIDE
jgi:multiple sugar transport system permease protein